MRVWIDAAAVGEFPVFGLSLVERHLRALHKTGAVFSAICIDGASTALRSRLPAELQSLLPLLWREPAGTLTQRLGGFLCEGSEPAIVIAADCVVDPRLFDHALTAAPSFVAREGDIALLVLAPETTLPDADDVFALGTALIAAGTARELAQTEFPAFIRGLRRNLPYYLLPVRSDAERRAAETFMFRANYKGSTDVLTKYIYPVLVWNMVRPLARLRVHPNWITGLNVLLGVAAVPAFWTGEYLVGFLCAYAMSILDSVDGKLARLTFTDSKLGLLLDHGLDLFHPPFWYLAWAWAATGGRLGDPVMAAGAMLVVIYILDRLVLKMYSVVFKRGLHAHAPIDARVRTFIARRNINLPLFTFGVIFGLEREAFLLIVLWQLATLVWHACRVGWILLFETHGPDRGRDSLAA